ncbi:MAG: cytidylate kinase-like family protein [Clostridiales bacterium]|nr:cytidylate kinase-like family protein [Clostridiales bacterium]
MLPVITIAREYGSAGHSIGEMVAKELGMPFYDSAILDHVAEQSGFTKDVVAEQGEYVNQRSKFWSGFSLTGGLYFEDPQDMIYRLQCKAIQDFAAAEPCVIVGRCADYVLNGTCDTLKVFIHSDYPYRIKRIQEVYHETPADPKKYLQQRDRNRATYYKYYTDHEWGDFRNYNLNLDSGYLGVEQCVSIIVNAARQRDTAPEPTLPPVD